jgi:quinol monooxygenase YgiN
MIVFIATLNVADGKQADFERLQTELSEISRASEPGLIVYDVIRHTEKAGVYVVYARFKDQEAFDFHQQVDYHERLVPPILECVEGEMDLQFFDWVA